MSSSSWRRLCWESRVAREALDMDDEGLSELDLETGLGLLAGQRDRGRFLRVILG